jgi:hypothetical protein
VLAEVLVRLDDAAAGFDVGLGFHASNLAMFELAANK